MKRKVIKQGNGTLTITLPKQWTNKVGLKGGDEIDVDVEGNSVRINTTKAPRLKEKTVDLSEIEVSAARVLSALYKQGYDEVRLRFDDVSAIKKIQNEVTKHLMTYEIVDQTQNSCYVKSLSTENYDDFDAILRKAFQVGLSLAKNSLEHVKSGQFDELDNLLVLENANNRFTSFCHRVIVKKGYKDQKKNVFMYVLIWQLEKAVDNYKLIVQYLSKNKKKPNKQTLELYKQVNDFFELFYQAFYKYDSKKMNQFSSMRKNLINRCN
ncbi:AbrB/MazE/SpoVT family DNA-binding domain-containing protein, partial [candidate division KSB1 bacterium]